MQLIETMLCDRGKVSLLELHVGRLLFGLYQHDQGRFIKEIEQSFRKVVAENIVSDDRFYRLRVLTDVSEDHYQLSAAVTEISRPVLQKVRLGIYRDAYKSTAVFTNAKCAERNIYDAALKWAADNHLDDAVIFNDRGEICDTGIYNIWLLKHNRLLTPPLSSLPVSGVFRTWLIRNTVFPVTEQVLTEKDLYEAEQILLTNAVRGMVWAELV